MNILDGILSRLSTADKHLRISMASSLFIAVVESVSSKIILHISALSSASVFVIIAIDLVQRTQVSYH
jgi:hypothetical protein